MKPSSGSAGSSGGAGSMDGARGVRDVILRTCSVMQACLKCGLCGIGHEPLHCLQLSPDHASHFGQHSV